MIENNETKSEDSSSPDGNDLHERVERLREKTSRLSETLGRIDRAEVCLSADTVLHDDLSVTERLRARPRRAAVAGLAPDRGLSPSEPEPIRQLRPEVPEGPLL